METGQGRLLIPTEDRGSCPQNIVPCKKPKKLLLLLLVAIDMIIDTRNVDVSIVETPHVSRRLLTRERRSEDSWCPVLTEVKNQGSVDRAIQRDPIIIREGIVAGYGGARGVFRCFGVKRV